MEPNALLKDFINIANGVLWLFATVVAVIRIRRNHLIGVEKILYIYGALSSAMFAVVNCLGSCDSCDELSGMLSLKVIEPFVAATVILFMLFYRNKGAIQS